MKRYFPIAYAAALFLLFEPGARAGGKLKLENLPEAVQKTVKAETQNATIVGISKEVEKGKTQYEVATKVNGRSRDFNVDTSGALVVVEEEVAIDSIPAAARNAIMQKVADGRIKRVETVKQGSAVSYEAAYVSKSGKKGGVWREPRRFTP